MKYNFPPQEWNEQQEIMEYNCLPQEWEGLQYWPA
jgi:hypothetical protein